MSRTHRQTDTVIKVGGYGKRGNNNYSVSDNVVVLVVVFVVVAAAFIREILYCRAVMKLKLSYDDVLQEAVLQETQSQKMTKTKDEQQEEETTKFILCYSWKKVYNNIIFKPE